MSIVVYHKDLQDHIHALFVFRSTGLSKTELYVVELTGSIESSVLRQASILVSAGSWLQHEPTVLWRDSSRAILVMRERSP
jgi:hypothetical protein